MNSHLRRVLGEDDAVPVPATARSRSSRERRGSENEDARLRRSRDVASVIGMTMESDDSIIPRDAENIEDTGGTPSSMAGMKAITDIVAKPIDPYSNGVKAYSPATALVAPDVTPNATKPLDPSKMPGVQHGTFTTAQVTAPQAPPPLPAAAPDAATPPNAMEILLGHTRGSAASTSPKTLEKTDHIPVTTESAAAMMGIATPNTLFSAAPVMEAGVPQPPPAPRTDIKSACDVARRWMG